MSGKTVPKLTITVFKWILTLGIIVYLALLVMIFWGSPVDISLWNIRIKAYNPSKPFFILVCLLFCRILLSMEKKNVLLVLGATFFSLLIVEAGLRVFAIPVAEISHLKEWRRPSPDLGWELIPGLTGKGFLGKDITINSHGLRDRERSWAKGQEYRILGLGDSFTFGCGVALEDTYLKQLEKFFKNEGKNIDGINAGVIGYNLFQSLLYLKLKGIKYQPDLIIYFFYFDDVMGPETIEQIEKKYNVLKKEIRVQPEDENPKISLYLINFIKNLSAIYDAELRPLTGADWLRDIASRKAYLLKTHWKIIKGQYNLNPFTEHLLDLKETCRKINANLMVVFIPDAAMIHDPQLQVIHQKAGQICTENQIFFVDITKYFEKETSLDSLYLFPVDAHTSPEGNRKIAEIIKNEINNRFNDGLKRSQALRKNE
jgi:lysophospholipase L1-like esterase